MKIETVTGPCAEKTVGGTEVGNVCPKCGLLLATLIEEMCCGCPPKANAEVPFNITHSWVQ
jgi:hypothetical protein